MPVQLQQYVVISNLMLIFKVKERLGGKLRVIVSGGAPLAVPVEEFLRVVTCAYVVQGYGMNLSMLLFLYLV
jgi:long-subunit acyl-CoA synthetase (AMP-forming)